MITVVIAVPVDNHNVCSNQQTRPVLLADDTSVPSRCSVLSVLSYLHMVLECDVLAIEPLHKEQGHLFGLEVAFEMRRFFASFSLAAMIVAAVAGLVQAGTEPGQHRVS